MVRASSGRPFVRTFFVTVMGAILVGGCFGLLFWWLVARDGDSASAPVSVDESQRAPIASGSGPVATPMEASSPADGAEAGERGDSTGRASPAQEPAAGAAAASVLSSEGAQASGSAAGAESGAGARADGGPVVASAESGSPGGAAADQPVAGVVPGASAAAAPPAAGTSSYDELIEQARRARKRRDFSSMLALSAMAAQKNPTPQALTLEAEALLGLENPERALAAVDSAISIKPRYAPAWYVKGRILRAMGQIQQARAALSEYLQLDPEGAHADRVIDLLQDM
jgi:hypothetical protein